MFNKEKRKGKTDKYDAILHRKLLNLEKTNNYIKVFVMCKKKHLLKINNITWLWYVFWWDSGQGKAKVSPKKEKVDKEKGVRK